MSDYYQVFVSYSHDTPEHIEAVLELSNRLRSEGIDCVLDQYVDSPAEGWPRWMDSQIRACRYVLMVCTEAYCRRVMGDEEAGKGHGVRWEGNLIYQHIYDAGSSNTKFIPVIREEADRAHVPTPIRGATIYALDAASGYDSLYRRVAEVPPGKPVLGTRRPLQEKAVKTNPSMFVTGPVDPDLWNKAGWRATFYGDAGDGYPLLGVAFTDRKSAIQIFEGWLERFGARDEQEELRISIIEGDIPGEEPGYTVHINVDTDVFIRRMREAGFEYDEDIVLSLGRLNRMNPTPDSPHLRNFKRHYNQSKAYWLVPGVMDANGNVELIDDLRIFKGSMLFRDVRDLHDQDMDYGVLASNDGDTSDAG